MLLLVWAFASRARIHARDVLRGRPGDVHLQSTLISLALTVLPPVYYPLSYLPSWAQTAAKFSPTTYAAQLVQGSVGLVPISWQTAGLDWGVLGGFTVALFVIAGLKARWQEP